MADIITYPENGITYDADDASGYLATRLSGVYSAEEDFSVTAQGGLSVQVSAGQAWVRPARFKGRSIIMEQPTTLPLTAADAVRSRIDRVVLRYDAAAKKTSLLVLDGTPDSAAPAAPAITRTELIYDLCLAEIKRPAGSTAVIRHNSVLKKHIFAEYQPEFFHHRKTVSIGRIAHIMRAYAYFCGGKRQHMRKRVRFNCFAEFFNFFKIRGIFVYHIRAVYFGMVFHHIFKKEKCIVARVGFALGYKPQIFIFFKIPRKYAQNKCKRVVKCVINIDK